MGKPVSSLDLLRSAETPIRRVKRPMRNQVTFPIYRDDQFVRLALLMNAKGVKPKRQRIDLARGVEVSFSSDADAMLIKMSFDAS